MAEQAERASTPREFGRDGTSGMVNRDRAIRAREVSRPSAADLSQAGKVLEQLIARSKGRRPGS